MTVGHAAPRLHVGFGHARATPDAWHALLARPILADRVDVVALVGIALLATAVRLVPVLSGGGLSGLLGYDDGVYYGSAVALVHGVLPYRDYLLVQPPGITLALAPMALLGTVIGDADAFAIARLSFMLTGALNAVLVALVAGRYGRLAGFMSGMLYALWSTASVGERTTDLHVPQHALLLLALLVLSRPGRVRPGRAALIGVLLGLATAVQLWQAASALVILWWVVVRARDTGWARLRPAIAFGLGAAAAFSVVCAPFLVAAGATMVRHVLVDQVGRPSTGVGMVVRLRALEGLGSWAVLPAPFPVIVVLLVAAVAVVLALLTGSRCPWARPWVALAFAQTVVVLATPSFFGDYAAYVAQSGALVIGTGLAAGVGWLTCHGAARRSVMAAMAGITVLLAVPALTASRGQPVPLGALLQDLDGSRCASSDTPALLVLTTSLRRNLQAGCPVVLDPTGIAYDLDRGALKPGPAGPARKHAPGYQRAMLAWYTSGDAVLLTRGGVNGLTRATRDAIEQRYPVDLQRGLVTVRLGQRP